MTVCQELLSFGTIISGCLHAGGGGGIGSYWGNLRSLEEEIRGNGETCSIIHFIKVMDSIIFAISQGSLRRGSAAVYLPISHPEIEEFIEILKPTGGDHKRKAFNLHHGIAIPDAFMWEVGFVLAQRWDIIAESIGAISLGHVFI